MTTPIYILGYECNTDIGILVDTSASMASGAFKLQINFIKKMVKSLNVATFSDAKVQVGVVLYSKTPIISISLDEFDEVDNFLEALGKLKADGADQTRVDLALYKGQEMFDQGARSDGKKVSLGFTF